MNTIMKGYRNILNHRSISSPIQTLLSVPELHRVGPAIDAGLADYTAGRELHPAPKKTVVQNSGANIYFLMVNKKIYVEKIRLDSFYRSECMRIMVGVFVIDSLVVKLVDSDRT